MPKAPPRKTQPTQQTGAPYPHTKVPERAPAYPKSQNQAGSQQHSTQNVSPPQETQQVEPLSLLEKRYRTFIRLDEPHDSLCYECFYPGELVPCGTCRKVVHADCMPPEAPWTVDNRDSDVWYCPVCVSLGWNHEKKRPKTTHADKRTLERNPWFPQILTAHPKAPPGTTYETSLMLDFALKKLTPVSKGSALQVTGGKDGVGVPVASASAPAVSASASPGPVTATPMQASPAPKPVAANGAWRGFSLPIARNTSNATLVPAPTPAPVLASTPPASLLSWRKSRFDILSGEVGAALSVVYRECEEVPLLRRTAEELETKMSSLQQEVNIYKNEMQLLKKSSSGTQITKVTSRKNHLERENVELRKQLENSEQALKQWKGKLAGILGQNI